MSSFLVLFINRTTLIYNLKGVLEIMADQESREQEQTVPGTEEELNISNEETTAAPATTEEASKEATNQDNKDNGNGGKAWMIASLVLAVLLSALKPHVSVFSSYLRTENGMPISAIQPS